MSAAWAKRSPEYAYAKLLKHCLDEPDRYDEEQQGKLMSDRHEFEIVCPNNHNQTVEFSQPEFEQVLKSGALVFHCNTCDTDWSPSGAEIAMFRKQFRKQTS